MQKGNLVLTLKRKIYISKILRLAIMNYICNQNINLKTNTIMIKVGDKAPEILGKDENGKEIRLSDYQGQKIVLYFYPKDNTSGCTAEACNLRDNYSEFRKKGYAIIGVSIDDERSHKKFIEKNNLPFPLIADTDKSLVQQFGVWGEKKLYGRAYMGTLRTTFIINEKGIVERIISPKEIKVKEHSEQILDI
jgi:peroxiredoxin Q/BCP